MQTSSTVYDPELWQVFSRTNDPEQLGQTWLAIVLNQFSQQTDIKVLDGLLAVGQPASADYKTVAFTSSEAKASVVMKQVGEQAMQRLAPVVQSEESKGLYFLACPLLSANQLYGVVVLTMRLTDSSQLTRAIEIVQWSVPVLVQRLTSAKPTVESKTDVSAHLYSLLKQVHQPVPIAEIGEWICTEQLKKFGLSRCTLLITDDISRSLLQTGAYTGQIESKSETEVMLCQVRDALLSQESKPELSEESDLIGVQIAQQDKASWGDWCALPYQYRDSQLHVTWLISSSKIPSASVRAQLQDTLNALSFPLVLRYFEQKPLTTTWLKSTRKKCSQFFSSGRRAAITLATTVLVGAFLFWPVNYQVVADVQIVGAERRVIAAPFDGYISQVFARPGDQLAKNQKIFSLDDKEFQLQKLDLKAKYVEVTRQMDAARGERDIAKSNIFAASQQRVEAEIKLLNDKLSRTNILSPIDQAIVVSGDLIDAIGTPVRKGEVLAELSPLNQYKLLIEVEQQDIGYVALEQMGRTLLTPIPNHPYDFTVSRVTPIAQAQEGKTVFRVEGILQGDVSELRPGMEGIAKIETTAQPRIWNWTRKLWAWISIKAWVVMP